MKEKPLNLLQNMTEKIDSNFLKTINDEVKEKPANILENISEKVSGDFLNAVNQAIQTGSSKMSDNALKLFRKNPTPPQLCPLKKPKTDRPKPTADPRTWEVISAIVDSGATVPAINPETGVGYEVEESEASRAGIEYDTAGTETLPALGKKRLAVITPEGTLRGYQSEVADVNSSLQSVRQMLANKHCVLFGLGPDGEDHLIVNKVSGEVNRMRDDGVNYIQDLLVVPPEHLEAVMAQMHGAGPGADPASPFGRQG